MTNFNDNFCLWSLFFFFLSLNLSGCFFLSQVQQIIAFQLWMVLVLSMRVLLTQLHQNGKI